MIIKTITAQSKHLNVIGGSGSTPYVNAHTGQTMIGQVRYNPSSNNLEVYDGSSWLMIGGGYATIAMSPHAESALDWAIQKQKEEQELDELCKTHPALAEAHERLQILKALTKQSESEKEQN